MLTNCRICNSTYKSYNLNDFKSCKFCGSPITDQEDNLNSINQRPRKLENIVLNIGITSLSLGLIALFVIPELRKKSQLSPSQTEEYRKAIAKEINPSKLTKLCIKELNKRSLIKKTSHRTKSLLCECYIDNLLSKSLPQINIFRKSLWDDLENDSISVLKTNNDRNGNEFGMSCVGLHRKQINNEISNFDSRISKKNRLGSPKYHISNGNKNYAEAVRLIELYANSNEFERYFINNIGKIKHTGYNPREAIKIFRMQLSRKDQIKIYVMDQIPGMPESVGSWNGSFIKLSSNHLNSPIDIAGTIIHETSHRYGWTHNGNNIETKGNRESFPYVVGYAFEDFLEEKRTLRIAFVISSKTLNLN